MTGISSNLLSEIPTSDSAEALRFCTRLAQFLTGSQTPPEPIAISVVVPIYNEQSIIFSLYSRLTKVLKSLSTRYEVIFVDDGSTDKSLELLRQHASLDPHVVILELARNFGHQPAISAGIDNSRGEVVIVMDGDLQDPPEAIPTLLEKLNQGYEVAYATRFKRKESASKRIAYALFYRALRLFAEVRIPLDAGDFSAMRRCVVDIMKQMPERNRFMRGVRAWIGFKQVAVPIERAARDDGRSKYTWDRLVSLALNGLITFSVRPLRLITLMGLVVSLLSIALAGFYLLQRLTIGLNPPGFPTIVVLLCFFAGMQLMTVGLIGEYVGRIFDESKKRPLYVVKDKYKIHIKSEIASPTSDLSKSSDAPRANDL